MAAPAPPHARRLLAYSDDRTIWLRRGTDFDRVVKVFERGNPAAAESEARAGARLRGPDFVDYLGVETDAETGRPAVITRFVDAPDLAHVVATQGPLTTAELVALGAALAGALTRIHALAVHRDVKPSNLLVPAPLGAGGVVLLDAEHAWFPREATPLATFTGGTFEWTPPEAHAGATPSPAFDVYGFGATLAFAASGRAPRSDERGRVRRTSPRRLAALPRELRELLTACLDANPASRPTLAECSATLVKLRELPMQRDTTARALEGGLARLDHRIARALAPLAPSDDFDALAARLSRTLATAARVPTHLGLRRAIEQLRDGLAQRLDALPARVAELKRRARFAEATAVLDAAARALRAALPCGGPRPALSEGVAPTPLQRTPSRLLQLSREDVATARARHEAMLAELAKAEAELDLGAAAHAIDHASAIYSGASEVVAELKDRLHRLTFFVERLAQPKENLTALRAELDLLEPAPSLTHLDAALERCRQQAAARTPRNAVGVRGLLRTLRELSEELPTTAASTTAARFELETAVVRLSERAFAIIDDSRKKLTSVPIPIRPLQNQLAHLDHLRLLDALADSPRGTRAELLDQLERLRTEIDQARTTRDRISSGAREAMERGHLTTALYDMARAVDRYDASAEELEEARQRKRAVEEAVRENHRLAARYAELEDDPDSSFEERIAVLEQRRQTLLFLIERVAAERAATYEQDRLDVGVRALQEHTADAERRHDASSDPAVRLEIARTTAASLDEFARLHSGDRDRLGRVTRMREHWQSLRTRAEADLQRAQATTRERERRRQRALATRALVASLLVALLFALYLLLRR